MKVNNKPDILEKRNINKYQEQSKKCTHDWIPLRFSHNGAFSGSFRCSKCNLQKWS